MTEIKNFRKVDEMQRFLEAQINSLKARADEVSKQIGEKMRSNESGGSNDAELQELRQKLEGSPSDPKKKKPVKRKDQKSNWHDFGAISIYDGIGIKGELELYFKAMEKMKTELDRITKVKQALDDLVSKGLKRDMGCILFLNGESPAEISFTSAAAPRRKVAIRTTLSLPRESGDI